MLQNKGTSMIKKILLSIIFSVQALLAQSVTITYDYDPIDRLTAVSYTTGETVNYGYDKAGNMTGVTHDGTIPGAALSLTPTSLSFGDQAVGTESASQTVTVANTGSVEITGLSHSEQSSEYSTGGGIIICDDTLAVGAECTITVRFTPTSEGTKTAILRVESAETDEQTVSLSGIGIAANDSDGDGYPDDEDAFPNDPDEWLDTDGDGIGNNADTDDDGDGMSDDFENDYGLDPLDASDANEDLDGDGYTNLEEYQAGTDPSDRDDKPKGRFEPAVIMYLLN